VKKYPYVSCHIITVHWFDSEEGWLVLVTEVCWFLIK